MIDCVLTKSCVIFENLIAKKQERRSVALGDPFRAEKLFPINNVTKTAM